MWTLACLDDPFITFSNGPHHPRCSRSLDLGGSSTELGPGQHWRRGRRSRCAGRQDVILEADVPATAGILLPKSMPRGVQVGEPPGEPPGELEHLVLQRWRSGCVERVSGIMQLLPASKGSFRWQNRKALGFQLAKGWGTPCSSERLSA